MGIDQYIQPLSMGVELTGSFILGSLILAFLLSSLISAVYRWTYQGLSYSRSYVHTQILAGIITAVLIMAIGNNLARGLGILGTLAIVRFRTPIRDPRDIIFLFACIAIGIACGAGVFRIAAIGSVFFCLVAYYLHFSPFGSRRQYEGLLRFMLPKGTDAPRLLHEAFDTYCGNVQLVAMREAVQGDRVEHAYQVRLLDPTYRGDLLDALNQHEEVSEINLLMQRNTVEI